LYGKPVLKGSTCEVACLSAEAACGCEVDEAADAVAPASKVFAAAKERLKSFLAAFEAFHAAQSPWAIPDQDLKAAVKHYIMQVGSKTWTLELFILLEALTN
jgi:Exo70 exocyst complex subunit